MATLLVAAPGIVDIMKVMDFNAAMTDGLRAVETIVNMWIG